MNHDNISIITFYYYFDYDFNYLVKHLFYGELKYPMQK